VIYSYLQGAVDQAFPEYEGLRVTHVAEMQGGWETTVYAFDVEQGPIAASNTIGLVARFYTGRMGPRQATTEAAVLAALARAGIPVPTVAATVVEDSPFGNAVSLMNRVSGRLLKESLVGSPDLIRKMAELHLDVHRLPVEAVFDGAVEPFSDPAFVAPDPSAMQRVIEEYGLSDFAATADWVSAHSVAQHEPTVLHNDYHPENILVDEDGAMTIIDWTFAAVGDYRVDLAWTAFWTGVMSGAGRRTELLDAYERAADRPLVDLTYFEALALAARLLTIALWLHDSVEPPVPKLTRSVIGSTYRPTVMTVYDRVRELTGTRIPSIERL